MVRISAKAASGSRTKLNRTIIVEAALAIVRIDGLDALTMRRIAADLDAGAMSLYRHVTDREDLLLGMMDYVAQRIVPPAAQTDEREEIVAIMMTIQRQFRNDPWLVHVLLFEGRGSLKMLPLLERLYGAMARLGCGPEQTIDYYSLLLHYTYGECLSFQTKERRRAIQNSWADTAFADFPATATIMRTARNWPYDEFERNLRRLVANI